MFEGNMQHDCHELLRCLLSYIEEATRQINVVRKENRIKFKSLLHALYPAGPFCSHETPVVRKPCSEGQQITCSIENEPLLNSDGQQQTVDVEDENEKCKTTEPAWSPEELNTTLTEIQTCEAEDVEGNHVLKGGITAVDQSAKVNFEKEMAYECDTGTKKRKRSLEESVQKKSRSSRKTSESEHYKPECKPNKENCIIKEGFETMGTTLKTKLRHIGSPIQQNSILNMPQSNAAGELSRFEMNELQKGDQLNIITATDKDTSKLHKSQSVHLAAKRKRYGTTQSVISAKVESMERLAETLPNNVDIKSEVADPLGNVAVVQTFINRRKQTARKTVPSKSDGRSCKHSQLSNDDMEDALKVEALSRGKSAVVEMKAIGGNARFLSLSDMRKSTEPVQDFVKNMFEGVMALRTRCFECEGYTERKEEYQDVSVPVRKLIQDDSDDETDNVKEALG